MRNKIEQYIESTRDGMALVPREQLVRWRAAFREHQQNLSAAREARNQALEEAAALFEVYAADQRACLAKGWVRGRGIKDAEVRAEVWAEAAQELRDAITLHEDSASAIRALKEG